MGKEKIVRSLARFLLVAILAGGIAHATESLIPTLRSSLLHVGQDTSPGGNLLWLGSAYKDLGDSSEGMEREHAFQNAIRVLTKAKNAFASAGDDKSEALCLARIAQSLFSLSQFADCITQCKNVIDRFSDSAQPDLMIAVLLQEAAAETKLGDYRLAGDTYRKVEPLLPKISDEQRRLFFEGAMLNGIGMQMAMESKFAEANDLFLRTAGIYSRLKVAPFEAEARNNSGLVLKSLGNYPKAIESFGLAISLYAGAGQDLDASPFLINRADAYTAQAQYASALADYKRGRDAATRYQNEYSLADCYHGWGVSLFLQGKLPEAREMLGQAMQSRIRVGDQWGIALTEGALAEMSRREGNNPECEKHAAAALAGLAAQGDRDGQADVFGSLMRLHSTDNKALSILYGKRAILLLEGIRSDIKALPLDQRKTYLDSKSNLYRELASLLVSEGRLIEAERVTKLLKSDEYERYLGSQRGSATEGLPLSELEASSLDKLNMENERVARLGLEYAALLEKKELSTASEADLKRLLVLSELISDSKIAFNQWLEETNRQVARGASGPTIQTDFNGVQVALKDLPSPLAIYMVPAAQQVALIWVSKGALGGMDIAISRSELAQLVSQLREGLEDPYLDPRPAGKVLYDLLIKPLEHVIQASSATTLMFSLDGVLQDIPMASLYDGEHFLAERFSCAAFSPLSLVSFSKFAAGFQPEWRGLGLGVSSGYGEFSPLPQVATELGGLFKTSASDVGIVNGDVLIDDGFTESSLRTQLVTKNYQIVHVATHCDLQPKEGQSFLLMGKGGHLSLKDFWAMEPGLRSTNLLTLSACETGVSIVSREGAVDNFVTSAQNKGVSSVVASLWKIDDRATSTFMTEFYRYWTIHGRGTKADALRAIQTAMIRGELGSARHAENKRSGRATKSSGDLPAWQSTEDFSHPYFWAPFVIYGDWR